MLKIPALKEAYFRRKPKKPLVLHSDKDSQYTSKEFRTLLKSYSFIQSMSSNGCYDNAPSESFFKTLKAKMQFTCKEVLKIGKPHQIISLIMCIASITPKGCIHHLVIKAQCSI